MYTPQERKKAWDDMPDPKVTWETFKRILGRAKDLDSAKKQAVKIHLKSTQPKKTTDTFGEHVNFYMGTMDVIVEATAIETEFEKALTRYIKTYKKSIDDLKKKGKKLGLSPADLDHINRTQIRDAKATIHSKESIIKKSAHIFNTAVDLNTRLKERFSKFSNDIKGKDADEIEKLSRQLSMDIIRPLKSWNSEMGMRDVTGHLTQPSKVVLTDFLRKVGINVPITYHGRASTPEAEQALRDYKINPEYPLMMLLNLTALQALNEVAGGLNPAIKPIVVREITKGIFGTRAMKTRIVNYLQDSNMKDQLSNIDLDTMQRAKKIKPDNAVNINQSTMGSDVKPDYKSLQSDIEETE